MTNNDKWWDDMGGKVKHKHNLLWNYTTDALPKLFYPKEVSTKAAPRILVFQNFGYYAIFAAEDRVRGKVQMTSPLKLNSKFTPHPSKKCILLGRIVNFQTQWESIRCVISWKGLIVVWCVQGHLKVIRCISDFYMLRHIRRNVWS